MEIKHQPCNATGHEETHSRAKRFPRPHLSKNHPPAEKISETAWEATLGRRVCQAETSAISQGKYRSYQSPIGSENPSEAGPTLCSCAPTSSPPALLAPKQQDLGAQGDRDKAAEISHVYSAGETTGVQPWGCSSSYGEILLLLSSLRRNSPLSAVFSTSKPETSLIWP